MSFAKKLAKLLAVLRVAAWRRALLRHGVAAGVEHMGALGTLGHVNSVVDIGAHKGQFSLAARQMFEEANIRAFEPQSLPAESYLRVFRRDHLVRLHQVAIGPSSGSVTLHLSQRDDSSSLLPISERQEQVFPGTGGIGTQMIEQRTLGGQLKAEALEPPALLKIDVQGFELEALRGCADQLHRFAWIYVECSFVELYAGQAVADQVIAWLRKRGFALRGFYNATYDRGGCSVQADLLFARHGSRPEPERASSAAGVRDTDRGQD